MVIVELNEGSEDTFLDFLQREDDEEEDVDNQLTVLPDSLGQLSSLAELFLTQYNFTALPDHRDVHVHF